MEKYCEDCGEKLNHIGLHYEQLNALNRIQQFVCDEDLPFVVQLAINEFIRYSFMIQRSDCLPR